MCCAKQIFLHNHTVDLQQLRPILQCPEFARGQRQGCPTCCSGSGRCAQARAIAYIDFVAAHFAIRFCGFHCRVCSWMYAPKRDAPLHTRVFFFAVLRQNLPYYQIRAAKRPAILPDKRREAAPKRPDKDLVRRFYQISLRFSLPVNEKKHTANHSNSTQTRAARPTSALQPRDTSRNSTNHSGHFFMKFQDFGP